MMPSRARPFPRDHDEFSSRQPRSVGTRRWHWHWTAVGLPAASWLLLLEVVCFPASTDGSHCAAWAAARCGRLSLESPPHCRCTELRLAWPNSNSLPVDPIFSCCLHPRERVGVDGGVISDC